MHIQVIGSGCSRCKELLRQTEQAVAQAGVQATIEYLTNLEQMFALGIMSMPALVVDGRILSNGRVLKASEIVKLLRSDNCRGES